MQRRQYLDRIKALTSHAQPHHEGYMHCGQMMHQATHTAHCWASRATTARKDDAHLEFETVKLLVVCLRDLKSKRLYVGDDAGGRHTLWDDCRAPQSK